MSATRCFFTIARICSIVDSTRPLCGMGIEIVRKFPTAAHDAVPETLLRAWRYRDSLKEGAPLRP